MNARELREALLTVDGDLPVAIACEDHPGYAHPIAEAKLLRSRGADGAPTSNVVVTLYSPPDRHETVVTGRPA